MFNYIKVNFPEKSFRIMIFLKINTQFTGENKYSIQNDGRTSHIDK